MTDYALHYGRLKKPLLFVVADPEYPPMYRIRWHDGRVSGLLNLTRACEAGRVIGQSLVPSNEPTMLRWQKVGIGRAGPAAGGLNGVTLPLSTPDTSNASTAAILADPEMV